jgi:hypothetical protein
MPESPPLVLRQELGLLGEPNQLRVREEVVDGRSTPPPAHGIGKVQAQGPVTQVERPGGVVREAARRRPPRSVGEPLPRTRWGSVVTFGRHVHIPRCVAGIGDVNTISSDGEGHVAVEQRNADQIPASVWEPMGRLGPPRGRQLWMSRSRGTSAPSWSRGRDPVGHGSPDRVRRSGSRGGTREGHSPWVYDTTPSKRLDEVSASRQDSRCLTFVTRIAGELQSFAMTQRRRPGPAWPPERAWVASLSSARCPAVKPRVAPLREAGPLVRPWLCAKET